MHAATQRFNTHGPVSSTHQKHDPQPMPTNTPHTSLPLRTHLSMCLRYPDTLCAPPLSLQHRKRSPPSPPLLRTSGTIDGMLASPNANLPPKSAATTPRPTQTCGFCIARSMQGVARRHSTDSWARATRLRAWRWWKKWRGASGGSTSLGFGWRTTCGNSSCALCLVTWTIGEQLS
jgi:hypothetical protein